MLSLIKSFINIFTRNEERKLIGRLYANQELLTSNLIALARLLLIHADTLKRESENNEANIKYLNDYR